MNLNKTFAPVAAIASAAFLTVAAPKAEAATVAHFNASGVIGPSSSPFSVTADFDLTKTSEFDSPTLTQTLTALKSATITVGTTTYSAGSADVGVADDNSSSDMTIDFEDITILSAGDNGPIMVFRFEYSSSPVGSILNTASYVEGFTAIADGSFGSPYSVSLFNGSALIGGTSFTNSVAIIPEPSVPALAALAVSTLLLRRRRDGRAEISEPQTQTLSL